MSYRPSFALVFLGLVGCSAVAATESLSSSRAALTSLPLTAGPLVNAEDSFRCNDIDGTFFAASIEDVQSAVRFAGASHRSLKVSSTRRGGHSGNAILCP